MTLAASFAIPVPGWALLPLLVVVLVALGFIRIAELLRTRSGSSQTKRSPDSATFTPDGIQSHGNPPDPKDSFGEPSLKDGYDWSTAPLLPGPQTESKTKSAFWLATRKGAIVAGAAILIGAAQRLFDAGGVSFGIDLFYQLASMRDSPLYLILLVAAAATAGWTATARGNSVVLWPGVAAGAFVVFLARLVPVLAEVLYRLPGIGSYVLSDFPKTIYFSLIGAVIALVAAAIGRPTRT